MTESLIDRFWSKVNKNGPLPKDRPSLGRCWLWTAGTNDSGYGWFAAEDKSRNAHRVAWWLMTGKWPTPCALHKCDNRLCVRFSHLEEGDKKKNNADCIARGRNKSAHVGEINPRAKLSKNQVLSIRSLRAEGKDYAAIALRYGISSSHACQIALGKAWSHIC